MANSAINISANAQEVINLRKRIDELKAALSSMRRSTDPQVYDKLNRELQTSSIRYNRLVGDIQRYVVAQQQAERATSKSSDSLTDLLKKGAALAGITFGAEKIRELGMEIVRVHGEMQQLNIAFSTMLKSQEKADALMSGLKTFATDTPFGLMDSAKGAKQLLAYGTTAENIIGDLKMLGNVASGVSAPLGDIVYLYGTLRSQGRAYAVDIRQFAGRGIPIYAELAKVLKVNVDQVNELVSAGKVGFPQVEEAFKNMTSGGGMFEGLMEKQTASVTGQIEKLKDNIQFMFDAIGTSSEGAIYGAIDGASTLVENYQAVGEALTALIATYGTYKAILIADTAIQGVRTSAMYTAEAAELSKLLTVEQAANVSKQNLTKGSAEYVAAIKAEIASSAESAQSKLAEQQADLNALMTKREQAREQMVNSQAKVQLLKQELAQTIVNTQAEIEASLKKRMANESEKQSRAALSVVRLQERKDAAIEQARALKEQEASAEKIAAKNREIASIQAKISVARQEEIQHGRNVAAARAELKAGVDLSANKAVQTATTNLNTATQQANSAAIQYNTLHRRYQVDWDKIQSTQQAVNTAVTNANTVATSANITVTQLLTAAKAKLWTATKNLFSVLVPNPYILVAAAVIGAGYAIYKYATYTTEAQKAIEKFNEESRNEIVELNGVFTAYKRANEGTEEKKKLLDIIKSKYGEYIRSLIDEKGRITDIEAAQRMANQALKESIALKIKNESITEITTNEVKKQAGYLGELRNIIAKTEGDEMANVMVSKIGDIFTDESKSARDAAIEAQKYLKEAGISMDATGKFWINSIGGLLGDMQNSTQNIKNEKKNLDDSFRGLIQGEPLDIYIPNKKANIPMYGTDYIAAKKEWNTAKIELSKIEKDKDKFTTKQYNEAKERVKTAKETYESFGGTTKVDKSAETAAEKARKLAQDQADRALKIKNDEIKSGFDLRSQQLENEEKFLNNQQDSFDKQQRQNELNYKKENLALEKHIQDLIETAQKAERDEWNQNNPKGSKTPFKTKINSLSGLSLNQQTASIQSDSLNNDAYAKATADTLKSLLNLYQDYNEQRRSINEKYDQDLVSLESQYNNAATTEEKARIDAAIAQLKKKWAEALSSVNIDELKESINWEKVFGDLDKVSTRELAKLRDKLKEYISSAGGSLSPQDLKTVTDAYDKLNVDLSQKKPVNELKASYEEYRVTLENVAKAKEKLSKLEKDTPAYLKAEKDLIDAQNENESARVKFAKGIGNTVSKVREYLEVANSLVSTLETMGVSIPDSTKQALEGFGQMLDGSSKFAEGYAEMNPAKMIQGAITQMQGYYNVAIGVFGSGKTLTQKQIDAYKDLLSVLDDVIARQKELLQNSSSSESSKYYQDALDTIEKQREAAKKFLSDDFFESKQNKTGRTYGARERRYIQQDDNQAKLKALGIELKNQYDLLNLTKDEILLIQQKMPGFYANLFDETKDYLQLIVDTEDKTKELGEASQEALTGVSFDNLKDSLDDLVQDVDTTFSDIGDSFEDHMRNAVMNFVKSSYLTAALQDWYDKFAEYAQSGSTDDSFGLTKDETDELRKMYENAYNKAQGLYDSALDAMGVNKGSSSSSQSSSYGTSTSMDQETGGAILGRLTGVHEELIGIGQNVGYIAQWNQPMDEKFNIDVLRAPIDSLSEACQRIELMIEENGNIALQTFYVVKDIKVDTSNLSEINDKLGRIENNTKAFKGK